MSFFKRLKNINILLISSHFKDNAYNQKLKNLDLKRNLTNLASFDKWEI